jgi:glycerophosphoryl diester phosphodiesterase
MSGIERSDRAPLSELGKFLSTPVAHRGLHDNVAIPENSLAAFGFAVQAGFPIECDVQMTGDGTLVVFHDVGLLRAVGIKRTVASVTGTELGSLRLFDTKETIPTLKQVLDLVAGRVPLLIEIKNDGKVGALEAAVVGALRDYRGPVALQAFNPFVLLWLKRNCSTILRGQISGDFSGRRDIKRVKKLLLSSMAMNLVTKPHFISFEIGAAQKWWFKIVRRLWRLPLLVWTIRCPADLQLAVSIGANVIFEGDAVPAPASRPPVRRASGDAEMTS